MEWKIKRNFVAVCLLVASATAAVAVSVIEDSSITVRDSVRAIPPLMLYEKVPMDNRLGRIDHMDIKENRIFFSYLGSNGVGVDNRFDGKEVAFIPGVPEAQGEVFAPGYDELFSASAQGKVYIFDGTNYRLKKTLNLGTDADDEIWDSVHKVVMVGFGEKEGGIAEIDPTTDRLVGKVLKTGGHPERFLVERHGLMIYVNCPDAGNVVEAINRNTGEEQKWSLHGLRENNTMALDEADHRLFTVTRKIPMLVVFDTNTGQIVARVPGIAGEADDAYFDAARKRIYIIGGSGFVSVVQEIAPDHYRLLANIPSEVGARTGYWYPEDDELYVAVQAEDGEPPEMYGYEAED